MRNFLGPVQQKYIGQLIVLPIKLAGIQTRVVPLVFDWSEYGASTLKPNVNVAVNLDNAVCKALDEIRSVYIDNLGSDIPVYVYFGDTQATIVAKPNSEGWYQAFTNQKEFSVIGEGFLTGSIPTTLVIVSNVDINPNVNAEIDNAVALWRASPIITRGNSIYNSSLGIPALGDQIFFSNPLVLNLAGNTVPLWGTPFSSGFLTITNLQISAFLLENPIATEGAIVLESTGIAGVLTEILFGVQTVVPPGVSPLLSITGNILLDATQTWRLRNLLPLDAGSAQFQSTFTYQP